ncbi:VOC family protein [Candidatus Leptofilum sp.]|uniref:VOC family protein n=1 Tax=Candidatus Leptofilum sp. TaxID=3241576 RepID=UPI003B5A8F76
MEKSITLIVYPVADVEKAKTFYNKFLGTEPYTDSAYYVGYKVGELEVGLDPNSRLGPIGYVDVTDIQVSIKEMVDVGAEIVQNIKDVGYGLLIAQVKNTDGNVVGLRQHS